MLLLFSCSAVSNSLNPMGYSTPGFPVLHHLPELAQTHVYWVSDSFQPSHPLLPLLLLPSVFLNIRVFSNESVLLIRWPKYCSFCFSISSFNEYSEMISFMMDWLDLLAAQEILKNLLQHYNQKPQFFGTWPSLWSNSHICTRLLEKPELWLDRPLSAVMPLLFNILSRFVIAFLPRSKYLLIS